jgi:hypothetical protein
MCSPVSEHTNHSYFIACLETLVSGSPVDLFALSIFSSLICFFCLLSVCDDFSLNVRHCELKIRTKNSRLLQPFKSGKGHHNEIKLIRHWVSVFVKVDIFPAYPRLVCLCLDYLFSTSS